MTIKKCPNCGGAFFVFKRLDATSMSSPVSMQYLPSYQGKIVRCYDCNYDLANAALGDNGAVDDAGLIRLGFKRKWTSSLEVEQKFGTTTLYLTLNSAKRWVIVHIDDAHGEIDRVFLPVGPKTLRDVKTLCRVLGIEGVAA